MKKEDEYLINLFFSYFKTRNKKLYSFLQKGISNDMIINNLRELGFKVPEEVLFYYSKKNGYKNDLALTIQQLLIFDTGIPMKFENSVIEYNLFLKYEPALKLKFPLFDSGGGDFLLIDCNENSKSYGKIFLYSPSMGFNEPITIYDSFVIMLSTIIRCFMVRAYYYDNNLMLNIDYEKQYLESVRLNPLADYWRLPRFS